MSEFDSCVHRIIKRIYPLLAYEYEMGLCESRGEPSGIYSFQLLRSLHENSMENIHKILRQTEADDDYKKEFDIAEKKILLEFFTYLNEKKSQLTQKWVNLQHYMLYIYRTLTSTKPQVHNKEISEYYIAEMKSLVKILSEADKIQLYLRIFSLLREYVTFAFWQYSKLSHKEPPIERIHRCYQAFLIASKNVYPVFSDLERLLKDKCNMTWMDYNKFVFFNYFYYAINAEILKKVNLEENPGVPKEYHSMILDFEELNTLWQTLKNLRGINENMDEEMSEDHKQILKKNFWICRKKTDREIQNVQRLAAELIILASERRIRGSEPFLDKNGQCLCEDCLIYKLSYIVEPGRTPDPTISRVSPCRYCPEVVELNNFHDHMAEHLKGVASSEDGNVAFTSRILENGNEISKMNKDLEKNGKDCEKKLSQCLINLLRKTNMSNKLDVKVPQPNTRPVEKKKEHGSKNNSKENIKITSTNKNESSCLHSCKHEEELNAELKKLQGACNHQKDSRRCDCTYCEVFGSNVSTHLHKSNETRNRLRIRLNQRKQKMISKNPLVDKTNKIIPKPVAVLEKKLTKIESNVAMENSSHIKNSVAKTVPKCVDAVVKEEKITPETLKTKTLSKTNDSENLNDIHGLVDFIEGNSLTEKVAIAEKKAAKKARQRQKKEEKRKEIEVEVKRKDAEIKAEEESKLKRLAHIRTDKNISNEENKKNVKKQKCKDKTNSINKTEGVELIEESIPATVTIKRSIGNGDNVPTVTITLKGSTPDQDKLLYALVKDYDQDFNEKKVSTKPKKNKKHIDQSEQKVEHSVMLQVLRKYVDKKNNCKLTPTIEKEIKMSFTVNNSDKETEKNIKQEKYSDEKKEDLELPFLKLPPGITITKVDGPVSNRNSQGLINGFDATNSNVSVNGKSGVIVVDTEKLMNTNDIDKISKNSRKNKKKKNKKGTTNAPTVNPRASMVTLKNPIFHHPMAETIPKEASLPMDLAGASCGQASIFKNENGMVTIRSSRLQQSLNNGVPLHNLLSDLKPVIGDIAAPIPNSDSSSIIDTAMNSFNAQEFLSGLPGIEITKIDKKNPKFESDPKSCQIAQVSIIPANSENCTLDKDEWIYDNIFTPKDVLEDDLDAEERELEAFKRFCQQSIPPKQKEKVAHLNVKDIILKKKGDINSV